MTARPTLKNVSAIFKLIGGFCAVVMLFLTAARTAQAHEVRFTAVAQVYFSPKGGCTEAIVSEINHAKAEILVQAYSFTSREIAKALTDAHDRGVSVQIILDKLQNAHAMAAFASRPGIAILIDRAHAAAHNKVMILDGSTIITGSFNFTKNAEERNAENLLILRSPDMARLYLDNWNYHRRHSETKGGRSAIVTAAPCLIVD